MEAGISFKIYEDFSRFFEGSDDAYQEALEELNNQVKDLVEKGELEFSYNGVPCKPILPIVQDNCGNIFGKEDFDGPCWDGVEVWVEIPDLEEDFESELLQVVQCPFYFSPREVLW